MSPPSFSLQNATDESTDKHVDSDKSNGHIKMNDSEKRANHDSDQAKLNDYVRIENSPRCRDSSVERKLKVNEKFMHVAFFSLCLFHSRQNS